MRICGVIASLGSGGAERVMTTLAAAWASRGDAVTLVTLDDGTRDFYPVPAGVRRIALGVMAASASPWQAVRSNAHRVRALRQALRGAAPDVIVSFTDITNVLTLLATRGMPTPVIVSERNDPTQYVVPRAWSALRRLVYPRAQALVVQTPGLVPWGQRLLPPARVHVIGNPLRAVPEPPRAAGDRAPIISAVGRLDPQKGFDVLLRAVALIHRDAAEWRVVIHGDGPERAALEALQRELGLADVVTFAGRTNDVDAVLSRASIFSLSSRYEGFPNVLLEAMANGAACVSTDCRFGPAQLLGAGAGLLTPVDDPRALASALHSLITDAGRRTSLGHAARAAARAYALPRIVEAWDVAFTQSGSQSRSQSGAHSGPTARRSAA